MAGIKIGFITAADLMIQLAAAKAQGRLKEYFNRAIIGPKLLVVDELGYLPFGRDEANLFFNVVARRYEHGSMILTSNLPFTQWASALADDQTLTAAMLDRGAAPRAHRADQRRQLPAQGQAQGRNVAGAQGVLIRGPGGSVLLRRPGRKAGQNYFGVDT